MAEKALERKLIKTDDPSLGVTVNPENDSTCIVTLLNYSDKDIAPSFKLKDGWSIKEIIYGDLDMISACDGVILRIEKT